MNQHVGRWFHPNMGHILLGTLPKSREWEDVVALVGGGASVSSVAAAAANAAHEGLASAPRDAGLVEALWLLLQLPDAAKTDNFATALRAFGVEISDAPTLLDLTASVTDAIDRRLKNAGGPTDLGEMAALAAAETVVDVVGRLLPSLFGATSADLRSAVAALDTEKKWGGFARAFFARFTQRYLAYYLSRELSWHVGHGERFATVDQHSAFQDALRQHCFEASLIVEEFAGAWRSKTRWEQGSISRTEARRFAGGAFKKIKAELRRREDARGG